MIRYRPSQTDGPSLAPLPPPEARIMSISWALGAPSIIAGPFSKRPLIQTPEPPFSLSYPLPCNRPTPTQPPPPSK